MHYFFLVVGEEYLMSEDDFSTVEPFVFEKELCSFQEAIKFSSILNGYGYGHMTIVKRANDAWLVKINIKDEEENYSVICDLFDIDYLGFNSIEFNDDEDDELYTEDSDIESYENDDDYYETQYDVEDGYLGDGMYKDPHDPRNDWNR
jgi:hypothetical protein